MLSGKSFPRTDHNPIKQALGQSDLPDVYVTIQHGSETRQTYRIDDCADPSWDNQVFDFVLSSSSASQEVVIKAYDFDIGVDDRLGSARVKVPVLTQSATCEIPLQGAPYNAEPSVRLMARWLNLSTNLGCIQSAIVSQRVQEKRPPDCSRLLLTINIDEVKNLPPCKRPFVRATVGSQKFETWAAYDLPGVFSVEHPDYEVSFHKLLSEPVTANSRVEFQVIDQPTGAVLGNAFALLADAVKAGPSGKVYTFALLCCDRADTSLRVRILLEAVIDKPPLWEAAAELKERERENNDSIGEAVSTK